LLPEIMIPLVGNIKELKVPDRHRPPRGDHAKVQKGGREASPDIKIGTMIEVPRAALTAAEIAAEADFFSFGTNDLTQMTFGFSRDDIGQPSTKDYLDKKIFTDDPFADPRPDGRRPAHGHGRQRRGRKTRKDLKMRHLRRARRRRGLGQVLLPRRPQLRVGQPLPRPRGAARGGPGGHRGEVRQELLVEITVPSNGERAPARARSPFYFL
jgi:hypothetical protein